MKLLNERNDIRIVAKRWAEQYPQSKLEIREALESLDTETATADDVAEIIGNRSWAGPVRCHECDREVQEVVQIGEPPNYESATACVCRDCLVAALALMSPVGNKVSTDCK